MYCDPQPAMESEENPSSSCEAIPSASDNEAKSGESVADSVSSESPEELCVLFHGISYLGCITVNTSRSEEASEAIKILRSQNASSKAGEKCTVDGILSVPNRADGVVRLLDCSGKEELTRFSVFKILHCSRGSDKGPERDCFAFTEAHESSGLYQCHVFKCHLPDAVKKIITSFEYAFQSIPRSSGETRSGSIHSISENKTNFDNSMDPIVRAEDWFCFNVTLEIREPDGKGGYAAVPWDKASSCFKLRKNLERQVVITISQLSNVSLMIERCFGLLLAPGRNVRHSDMHLLDMDASEHDEKLANDSNSYYGRPLMIVGIWHPSNGNFALLNEETRKGTRVFLSFAVDLVIREVQEPVRLMLETKTRIFPQNEKFWYFGKKQMQEMFFLKLKEVVDPELTRKLYNIISIENERSRQTRLSHADDEGAAMESDVAGKVTLCSNSPQDEEDDDDMDEPLLSGSGEVKTHDCSDQVLTDWSEVLDKWRANFSSRPNGLKQLVRKSIPNALRGEVWQLLAGCHDNNHILEQYRLLISKESPQDDVIQRDVHRTFPAHDFFKDAGGSGQESLYRIGKAYSLYDQEVGYCQGLSFLAAALLLHMPEEQAFGVLCQIMFKYNMRELFKNGFKALRMKFFQLEKLVEELIPELGDHFKSLSVAAHMYSSQWFLTLYTAKFPLGMVYRIIDLFLSEGEVIIFKIALGLLQCSRQELLTLDFEGILKYFRVSLPKKYRTEEGTKALVKASISVKVTLKKLQKFAKAYDDMQEKLLQRDPNMILERDNHRLMEANMRLEAENDELAEDLICAKLDLESQLSKALHENESLRNSLLLTKQALQKSEKETKEITEENQRLSDETRTAKELCRKEMEKQDSEISKKTAIIQDYKAITSQLSLRLEHVQNLLKARSENSEDAQEEIINKPITKKSESHTIEKYVQQIRDLELELARTKLSKVESECKVQELEHELSCAIKEVHSAKSTWLHKTLSNFTSKNQDSRGPDNG